MSERGCRPVGKVAAAGCRLCAAKGNRAGSQPINLKAETALFMPGH
jgi:hypothetical protein